MSVLSDVKFHTYLALDIALALHLPLLSEPSLAQWKPADFWPRFMFHGNVVRPRRSCIRCLESTLGRPDALKVLAASVVAASFL